MLELCLYPFILSAPGPYPGGIIAVSGTRTVVLEWNFIARIILGSIALLHLFSAICIIATGSHHAIIGPRKGCQLKRLYALCNYGEHLSVLLASFELWLNIIFSPHFNQLQCLFVAPQRHYFLDQGCSIALALASSQSAS